MDVIFVDVGFGTCNLILTGSGEAIVIDAGERPKEPLAALHHFSVRRIRHLIVSHWHADHVGGATGLLRAYSGRVGTVWFPGDPSFQRTEFWTALVKERDAGRIGNQQIRQLAVDGTGVRPIWDSQAYDADLKLVSPSFMESLEGVAAGDSNATCGILILRLGTRHIVFAGDAALAQWQEVRKRMAVPIEAEVVAVPHHAGIMWPAHWNAGQVQTALLNLYTKLVRPRVAVISASTRPGEKHPRSDVIEALRKVNAKIMCTQMTHRCAKNLEAEREARVVALPLLPFSRSSATPIMPRGKSSHVACAGSVFVELRQAGAEVHRFVQHQKFVDTITPPDGVTLMCRT